MGSVDLYLHSMRRCIFGSLLLCSLHLGAQDIIFHPSPLLAESGYAASTPKLYGHCTDSLRVDTIYTERISNGEMEMVVQTYPLARYEFYLDGALYRRIDIEQVEIPERGSDQDQDRKLHALPSPTSDIPNGAYHEFFPNGNIRIKGTLAGYNSDGTLKKSGEWREWDKDENVIWKETYP